MPSVTEPSSISCMSHLPRPREVPSVQPLLTYVHLHLSTAWPDLLPRPLQSKHQHQHIHTTSLQPRPAAGWSGLAPTLRPRSKNLHVEYIQRMASS